MDEEEGDRHGGSGALLEGGDDRRCSLKLRGGWSSHNNGGKLKRGKNERKEEEGEGEDINHRTITSTKMNQVIRMISIRESSKSTTKFSLIMVAFL